MTDWLDTFSHPAILFPFSFCFGLILGSFFNVVIVRLPYDESVVRGGSKCPKCQAPIPWTLNIPVFSWLWLRGKCRACKAGISIQYPLVELATGLLWLGLAYRYGSEVRTLTYGVFLSLLLVISVIDFHHRIIPDELSLPGIVLGVLASWLTNEITWYESVIGAAVGGGIFFGIAFLYEWIAKREGLGGGDVKLLAMIGAWLGYQSILIIIILSTGIGSLFGIAVMVLRKQDLKASIPFGPFLAGAAVAYWYWRVPLLNLFYPDF